MSSNEEVPPMDVGEGSRKRRVMMEFLQAEKMEKTVVEVLDREMNGGGAPAVEAEKMDKCAETFVDDTDDLTELAKLLNKSEDWIEKRRKQARENAARSKRISDHFLQFCVNQEQGCLKEEESDEEDDDEYDARYARMEKFTSELWSRHKDLISRLKGHHNPQEDTVMPESK